MANLPVLLHLWPNLMVILSLLLLHLSFLLPMAVKFTSFACQMVNLHTNLMKWRALGPDVINFYLITAHDSTYAY